MFDHGYRGLHSIALVLEYSYTLGGACQASYFTNSKFGGESVNPPVVCTSAVDVVSQFYEVCIGQLGIPYRTIYRELFTVNQAVCHR